MQLEKNVPFERVDLAAKPDWFLVLSPMGKVPLLKVGFGFSKVSHTRLSRTFSWAVNDCFWPILLKKSAMVSTAEKYALEIEIFTLSRG
ncbi:MAG: hypothetical protein ACRESJ_11815, partial [Pseudomonas sp.]